MVRAKRHISFMFLDESAIAEQNLVGGCHTSEWFEEKEGPELKLKYFLWIFRCFTLSAYSRMSFKVKLTQMHCLRVWGSNWPKCYFSANFTQK